MSLAINLKRARKARRLTQHALADLSGISRSTIALIETGQRPNSWSKTIESLAIAMDTSVAALLGTQSRPRRKARTAEVQP
jgi:transcriptional regulator with XRE-family HTH domain